jgi:hypothetical protein
MVTRMEVHFGYGGWVEITDWAMPAQVFARFEPDERGRWDVHELYLCSKTGDAIPPEFVRRLPTHLFALIADTERERLRMRARHPGPDLKRLIRYYKSAFGTQARHWVADSWRAQIKGSGVPQARLLPPTQPDGRASGERPPLRKPERLDDEFLAEFAEAYRHVVAEGKWPAPTFAAEAQVTAKTVHKWVAKARERGYLPPGKQGNVG